MLRRAHFRFPCCDRSRHRRRVCVVRRCRSRDRSDRGRPCASSPTASCRVHDHVGACGRRHADRTDTSMTPARALPTTMAAQLAADRGRCTVRDWPSPAPHRQRQLTPTTVRKPAYVELVSPSGQSIEHRDVHRRSAAWLVAKVAPGGFVEDGFRTRATCSHGRPHRSTAVQPGRRLQMASLVLEVSMSLDDYIAPLTLHHSTGAATGSLRHVPQSVLDVQRSGAHDGVHGAPDVRPCRADRCHPLLSR